MLIRRKDKLIYPHNILICADNIRINVKPDKIDTDCSSHDYMNNNF